MGRAGIELATPGYAVRHVSAVRHVTDCPARPFWFNVNDILRKIGLISDP